MRHEIELIQAWLTQLPKTIFWKCFHNTRISKMLICSAHDFQIFVVELKSSCIFVSFFFLFLLKRNRNSIPLSQGGISRFFHEIFRHFFFFFQMKNAWKSF